MASNNELAKATDEFFSRELLKFEVFDEFSLLSEAVQKFITTDKALTLKLISSADGNYDPRALPAAIFEEWRDDKDVWLELIKRNYDALELVPTDMVDDNFAIESLRFMFSEEDNNGEGDTLFGIDMKEGLESWWSRFKDSEVASSTSFFKSYLALEDVCLQQPDEPFLFWVFSIARPAVFRDDTLCSDFIDAFRERVSKLTSCLVTFFGRRHTRLNYTWNAVAHPAVFDRCVRASDYKNNPDIAIKLRALRQAIARNFEVIEDFRNRDYEYLNHLTDNQFSTVDEVSSAQDWDNVLLGLMSDIVGPEDSDTKALEKNSFGREELEAKISCARKSCISKFKSVYFGALSDSDLELAGKYSEDAEVLAMLFRSKSHSVREALATNGRACAYNTSLGLLNDKIVAVKEAVLSHAWLHDDDFKVLCEMDGFRTNKMNHLRVFTSDIVVWNDLQFSHLVKNANVSEELLRGVNLDAIANAKMNTSWGFKGLRAPERADAKAKELKRIESQYINQQGRETFHLNLPHPELSASERERLRNIEEELRQLNIPTKKGTTSNQGAIDEQPVNNKSQRIGISKARDQALSVTAGLTNEEFEYLIFGSRDEKSRTSAIGNPEMPFELFDRVLSEFPEDAPSSNYFWLRYLENPAFLGKPELQRTRKLLSNPEVPESFIVATFQRFLDGEEERAWRKWRTTLIAIASHPNTPQDVLKRLLGRNKKELNDAIKVHPRMQGMQKKEVKREGRRVIRQYDEVGEKKHICSVEPQLFVLELRSIQRFFKISSILPDSMSPDAALIEEITQYGPSSLAEFLKGGQPSLSKWINKIEALTSCTTLPFFSTRERVELRFDDLGPLPEDLDSPAMSVNAYEKFLLDRETTLDLSIAKDLSIRLVVGLEPRH